MKKLLMLLISFFVFLNASAQTKPVGKQDSTSRKLSPAKQITAPGKTDTTGNRTEKFVKNDTAYRRLEAKKAKEKLLKRDSTDLRLALCGFEKDANAMVLSDEELLNIGGAYIISERAKRIKIFNDNGKDEANIRIEYNNKFGPEEILAVIAETINFNNGKVEYTPLEQGLIYNEHTDKNKDAIVFSFPNVKPGSIIEYAYVMRRQFSGNFPEWDFQSNLPQLHSQLTVFMDYHFVFNTLIKINKPFKKDSAIMDGHTWVLDSVTSAKTEPFMRSEADGLLSLKLALTAVKYIGKEGELATTWSAAGKQIADDKHFNKPFDQKLADEDGFITKANALKTDEEKIAYLFNLVKTSMKWNEEKNFFSKDGIKNAWKKKSGNWGEINMVLCHLLKQSGVKAYPMLVSTRDNGQILPNFVNLYQINKLVTYVPVDSATYYVLDASDKYAGYKQIPYNLLNSFGLYLDKEKAKYGLVSIKQDEPVKQTVFINAEIKPDGTMKGTAQIGSFSYNKSNSLELYKILDEKKYKNYLADNDNSLKITSLKFEDAEIDSLPLVQNLEFTLDLPGTDDKYIYFNPNLFTSLHNNPFINENRVSDIDFGCLNTYSINGRYKIPDGYKLEALPKSMNLLMPDKSISFRRIIGEENGYIVIHYVINYKKSTYPRSAYPGIYNYFKRMSEILNEQIVLKKT